MSLENLSGEQPDNLERYGRDNYPMSARDVLARMEAGRRHSFPFESWAANVRFQIPPGSGPFFAHCESAAEAFFIRPFTQRPGVRFEDRTTPRAMEAKTVAVAESSELELQVRCALYRIDAVLRAGRLALAIEIDGLTYHRETQEQIAADYLKMRRIVVSGYTLVRFTASEAFSNSDECWRQIDAIVAAHTRSQTTGRRPENRSNSRSNQRVSPVDSAGSDTEFAHDSAPSGD